MKRRAPFLIIVIGVLLAGSGLFLWRYNFAPLRPFEAVGRGWYAIMHGWKSYRTLLVENNELKVQITRQSVDRARLETAQKENSELKSALNYETTTKKIIRTARVTTRIKDPFVAIVRIDQGARDGIVKEASVVTGEGIYVGTIATVYEKTADVLMAIDARSKVRAHVVGRDGAIGVLEGHGVLYRLTMVPATSVVQNGDVVVVETAGSNETLVTGTVEGIDRAPDSPFQTFIVQPLFDFNTVTFVSVLF